jgi:3-dehydroquinate synthase
VAYGMLVAAEVAVGRDAAAASLRDRLAALVRSLGPLPAIGDLDAKEVVAITRRDKKVVDGRLHFVLATGIGSSTIADDVTEEELIDALVKVGFAA